MSNELAIRNMTRSEVDELVAWAAREGWNPGVHDAEVFWTTDPEAFLAADLDGGLIGGGAITSYSGDYGFMGFFIVRPAYRGRGFGNTLWHARLERLVDRLRPGTSIGLDGVFEMQHYYARGGFVLPCLATNLPQGVDFATRRSGPGLPARWEARRLWRGAPLRGGMQGGPPVCR